MARAVDSKRNDRPVPVDSRPNTVESRNSSSTWEQTAGLAYSFWEARGYHGGSPEEDWFRAVQELARRRETPGGPPGRSKSAKVG